MPEKYGYRVITQDLAVADLHLEAKVDEGFEVLDVGINGGAALLVATLIIGNEIMTGFPCSTGLENVVPVPRIDINTHQLIPTIVDKFPQVPLYKVSAGETLIITSGGAAGVAYVIYRQLSGAEIPAKSAVGASEGSSRLFISHGSITHAVGIGATEDFLVNVNLNPVGLTGFPFGELVPVNIEFDLLGLATNLGAASGAGILYDGFRIWKAQESILREDQAFVDPLLYPYNSDAVDQPIFTLPKALTFIANEELKIEARATGTGVGIENAVINFTVIFLMRFLK